VLGPNPHARKQSHKSVAALFPTSLLTPCQHMLLSHTRVATLGPSFLLSLLTQPAPQARDMPGHNSSLAILGIFILWFGWYGFNPGSTLAILDKSTTSAIAAVNTTLSGAAGTLSTLFILMAMEKSLSGDIVWDLLGAANGSLAGLVGITGGAHVVQVCVNDLVQQRLHTTFAPDSHLRYLLLCAPGLPTPALVQRAATAAMACACGVSFARLVLMTSVGHAADLLRRTPSIGPTPQP
jgi:hypothetical protein